MLIFNSWHTAGKSNIFTADDDGSHLRCLTSRYNLQRYQRLRISPHRNRLLFYAHPLRQETGRFFFWEFDGDQLKVYAQERYPYDMRWLANDKLLCIKKGNLWIANLENSELSDLDFSGDYLAMAIAPDGNRLLLKKRPGIGGSIYVGDIAQRQVQEIVRGEDYEKSHAILYPSSWSPDGQTIACIGGHEDEVWLVNADGSNPHKAADTDYFWKEIQWSPDGSKIAFTRGLDGGGPGAERGGIFVQDLQSGEENHVLTLRRAETWRWATDAQSIVHSKGKDDGFALLRINIQTGSINELIGYAAELKDIDELIVA